MYIRDIINTICNIVLEICSQMMIGGMQEGKNKICRSLLQFYRNKNYMDKASMIANTQNTYLWKWIMFG